MKILIGGRYIHNKTRNVYKIKELSLYSDSNREVVIVVYEKDSGGVGDIRTQGIEFSRVDISEISSFSRPVDEFCARFSEFI